MYSTSTTGSKYVYVYTLKLVYIAAPRSGAPTRSLSRGLTLAKVEGRWDQGWLGALSALAQRDELQHVAANKGGSSFGAGTPFPRKRAKGEVEGGHVALSN